ncbi:hypothetical protein PENANT_c017G00707 [Penicillium antarcticum]|uniref:Transcription factor domain-containing protein n=1 Tax=Penicillium antarcticum TaxID=416450 RepID=A0A1V6Q3E0_9EURO|nr:hypothetical protein PENANT_c017G00707 [Penicillium antarcticum]
MVYGGKPSTGCQNCRKRHIKPMEDTVVPLFFNSYLYLPKDPHIQNGFMEILPISFSNAKPHSHLHVSTLAVAFFSVAAWTGQSCLLRASEQYFTQALPKIRESLQDENSDFDSILLSILLLSTYEVSQHDLFPSAVDESPLTVFEEFVAIKDWENPMKAHLRGAIALINSRKSKRLQTAASRTIDHAVQTQIVKTSRGLTSPTVPIPKVWPLSQPAPSSGPRPLLASAAAEIVNLRLVWEGIIDKPAKRAEITSLLTKAIKIDTNLAAWAHLVPQHWTPVAASIIPQSVRNAGIYNDRVDCYTDMWIASTWNTYRDCRILVQSIILSCLRMAPSNDPQGLRTMMATTTAHRLADEICACLPFFLGSQLESVHA